MRGPFSAGRRPAARVRLMPIVVVALVGLLSLRLLSMLLNGGWTLPASTAETAAPAQPQPKNTDLSRGIARVVTERRGHVFEEEDITGAVDKKKDEAKKADKEHKDKEQKAAQPAEAEWPGTQRFNPPATDPRTAGQSVPSEAELKVLERLRQRRTDIETRDQELEMRENLLRATERKLDERIGELRTLEGKLDVGQSARKQKESEQLRALVVMYEAMKPKDAARVFDRLEAPVLIDLVTQMNPRKTSEILAAMNADAAQRLTVALARRAKGEAAEREANATPAAQGLPAGELPRIDSVPARP